MPLIVYSGAMGDETPSSVLVLLKVHLNCCEESIDEVGSVT